jgi:hypothetical protein
LNNVHFLSLGGPSFSERIFHRIGRNGIKAKKTKNSGISLFCRVFLEVVLIESNALESLPISGTSL